MDGARPPVVSTPVRKILESVQRIDARLAAEAGFNLEPGRASQQRPAAVAQDAHGSRASNADADAVNAPVRKPNLGRPGGLQYYFSPFDGNARLHSSSGGVIEARDASAVLLDVRQAVTDGRTDGSDDIARRMVAIQAEAEAEAAREEREIQLERAWPVGAARWEPELQEHEEGAAPGEPTAEAAEDEDVLWVQSFDGDGDAY